MNEPVIVQALRTPLGKRNGALASIHPADLSAVVLRALVDTTGIDPGIVDDVVWGCVSQTGEQTFNIARTAVLSAGWPESVPGVTVDRQCGSSQQAVHFAIAGVAAGHYDVVVAGGVESMSRIPMFSAVSDDSFPLGHAYAERYGSAFPSQGLGAEAIAAELRISRGELDEFSLESHRRATAAWDTGRFAKQVVPVVLPDGSVLATDEGMRRDTTLAALEKLSPAFVDHGVVTAGNASQISDGAAGLLIMSRERARQLGLTPLARVAHVALAGTAPMPMLEAPVPATHKVLAKSGLRIEDVGAAEVNEAFAAVPLAWQREFQIPETSLNPLGGAIALGHPLGASGARIMTTLVHHLRDTQARWGLQTMCEAGGLANATLLEAL
ncbi:thiolase family protein [Streptomyces sp. NPDC001984]|uniref:thiolase family protein n=1 Tax=Streptomyces sp. NPDC002619 TaxID=3364655 RepID=UPI003676654D